MPCNAQETTLSLVQKRILIADDHLAVREGLRSLIDPDPDFTVVGEAADGSEAARKALELRPDLILLDNSMPGMTGLEVARMLRDNLPATKIVFLTMDPGIRDLALATGAAAHISKDQPPQEIMRVVRAAAGIAAPKATTGQPASAQAKLAELLISEKALTSRQIQDLDKSRDGKQTLSNAILRSGLVAPETLASALARVSGHPVTSLRVAPEAAATRPARECEHARVVDRPRWCVAAERHRDRGREGLAGAERGAFAVDVVLVGPRAAVVRAADAPRTRAEEEHERERRLGVGAIVRRREADGDAPAWRRGRR